MSEPIELSAERKLKELLSYAARGWHIFPLWEVTAERVCTCPKGSDCGNAGKHPRIKHGFKGATTNEEQIRTWHRRNPSANWGVACGPSGLAVVDVDPRNGGEENLRALETEHEELADTIRANTGGGGQHYLYSTDEPAPSRVLTPGVDFKSTGGYIVLPPSNHVSGGTYTWDAGAHPSETPLAPLPDWVRKLAGDAKRTEKHQPCGAVTESYLGAAFQAMGWMGRALGPDKSAVQCPWESEHTGGHRYDSSTVIFGPRRGSRVGWFHCSHAHCSNRTLREVLDIIPEQARQTAREAIGADPQYNPHAEVDEAERARPLSVEDDGDWVQNLRFTNDGRLTRDAGNAGLILANDEHWSGCLQYDEFADRIRWARPAPPITGLASPDPGDDLSDHHVTYVHHWFARLRGVSMPKGAIQDALESAARSNPHHPVRDYLSALQWDGTPRIATWLQSYLGAADTSYIHATGRWWLISAVARVMMPGCQADHLLVLEGAQGSGKSTAARILGGDWFLSNLPDISSKDAAQVLQGHWISEIGELDAFKGAAGTRVKDWVTRETDSYRPAYGRFTVRRPRQCVFIGTTNEHQYLTDGSGGRRFWPVAITRCDRDRLRTDRDQLWAEAVHAFHAGEQWHPTDELKADLTEAQDDRFDDDEWGPRIAHWASTRDGFTVGDVLAGALSLEPAKWDRRSQIRAGTVLQRMNLQVKRVRENGSRARRYYRVAQ